MEFIAPILNTVLLIAIFFYQKYRNRVLEDKIKEQSGLLSESGSLIGQLVHSIEGQKSVVNSAIDYANAFNPEKFSSVIRKQIEQELNDKISSQEEALEKATQEKSGMKKEVRELVNKLGRYAAYEASMIVHNTMQEPLMMYIESIEILPEELRNQRIEEIVNVNLQEIVRSLLHGSDINSSNMNVEPSEIPDDLQQMIESLL